MDQHQYQENESSFQIKRIQINHNNKKRLDILIPLNENKILIYFKGGEWILYNIDTNQVEKRGQMVNKVRVFFQVWDGTLFYIDPDILFVKLIDFNTGLNNPFYEFPARKMHYGFSDQYTREIISKQFLFGQTEYQEYRYLVTIEQQIQCSCKWWAIICVRRVKQKYNDQPSGIEKVLLRQEYRIATKQTDIHLYNTDPQSLALYGMDFENGQMEFALIKPHLGDKALRVIRIQEESSYTLMNVTNWIYDNQIALWLNNNDEYSVPMIQIIDERSYYDSQNNSYRDGEVLWNAEKVSVQFQADPPQTLIDVLVFPHACQYSVIQRLVGVEPYISLIDWKNHSLVYEQQIGELLCVMPQNKNYIIQYDENPEISESINIKLIQMKPNPRYCIDPRFYILKFMEHFNVIQTQGIDNIFDTFKMMKK